MKIPSRHAAGWDWLARLVGLFGPSPAFSVFLRCGGLRGGLCLPAAFSDHREILSDAYHVSLPSTVNGAAAMSTARFTSPLALRSKYSATSAASKRLILFPATFKTASKTLLNFVFTP
jgi:hypothetical protein